MGARGGNFRSGAHHKQHPDHRRLHALVHRITASTTPESSDTGIGEPLVRRPRNSGSLSIAVTPKRWSFVVGGSFVGERQDADFTFGVTRNPGYENIYASASYDIAKHFTPILKVEQSSQRAL